MKNVRIDYFFLSTFFSFSVFILIRINCEIGYLVYIGKIAMKKPQMLFIDKPIYFCLFVLKLT